MKNITILSTKQSVKFWIVKFISLPVASGRVKNWNYFKPDKSKAIASRRDREKNTATLEVRLVQKTSDQRLAMQE